MALTMALALPRKAAFLDVVTNNDSKYLGLVSSTGSLEYNFAVLDVVTKFEVEDASIGEGYVNIRSCCNNKYWVRLSETDSTLVAAATKPNENSESWDCTLLKPEYVLVNGTQHVTFLHKHDNQYLVKNQNGELSVQKSGGSEDVAKSRITNYEHYVILPKYVAFKADNGSFYRLDWQGSHPYVSATGSDSASLTAVHETSYNRHGNYMFKNAESGKFWTYRVNWIWVDTDNASEFDINTLFFPIKVRKGVIGLRCLGNHQFVKRLTTEGKTNCLNAAASSIVKEANLEVIEPVLSRTVRVTRFRMEDARIYDKKAVVMAKNSALNSTSSAISTSLGFNYTKTKRSTWSNSVNVTTCITVEFKAGIPEIAEGGIKISTEISFEKSWEETTETSEQVTTSTTATVKPHTEIELSLVATQGKCNIPFTYEQTDTLVDGTTVRTSFDDGVFDGVNFYHFHYDTDEKPIPKHFWA